MRYLKRHHLPPLGAISRYIPPPSNRRIGLLEGIALRIALSVRGMGATLVKATLLPRILPPVAPRLSTAALGSYGNVFRRFSEESAGRRRSYGHFLEFDL